MSFGKLMLDNAVVVAYLNRQVGTVPPDGVLWCSKFCCGAELHMVEVVARYFPGWKNFITD